MEDLPPPYRGSSTHRPEDGSTGRIYHVGSHTIRPLLLHEPDFTQCSHRHDFLATIATDSTAILHHWHWDWNLSPSPSPSLSLSISTTLHLADLQHIHGFRDLETTFQLPTTDAAAADGDSNNVKEQGEEEKVHNYLTSLAMLTPPTDSQSQPPSSPSLEGSNGRIMLRILDQLRSRKRTTVPTQAQGQIRLCTVPIFSNSPCTPDASALFSGGYFPVWRWVKPESVYGRTAGFWETDVSSAVDDGQWNTGKELRVIVRGVSDEKGLELKSSEDRVMRL